jgi:hypothetical protein
VTSVTFVTECHGLSRFLTAGTISVTSVTNALKGIVTSRCHRLAGAAASSVHTPSREGAERPSSIGTAIIPLIMLLQGYEI